IVSGAGTPVLLLGLVRVAERLAIVKPAQGLEGAAIALREAAGGQFESLRERFEFDTAAVQRLRDQGVPAIEAVSRVLDQMGVSAGSVERMGRTVEGRTATIRDFFDQFRGAVGGGLFQRFETALGVVVTLIDRYGASGLRAPTRRWLGRFAGEVTRNFTGPAMALLRVFAPEVWQTINGELERAAQHTG